MDINLKSRWCRIVATTMIASVMIVAAKATVYMTGASATLTFPISTTYSVANPIDFVSNHSVSFYRPPSPGYENAGAWAKNGYIQGAGSPVAVSSQFNYWLWPPNVGGSSSYSWNPLIGSATMPATGQYTGWAKTTYQINGGVEQLGDYDDVYYTVN